MARYINADKFLDKLLYMGYMDEQKSEVEEVANNMIVEAIPKADYETRLKADLKAILVELQLEIKELFWDNRYDVWLDNQYYIGKSDMLEEVDEVIQQKINALKGENETC